MLQFLFGNQVVVQLEAALLRRDNPIPFSELLLKSILYRIDVLVIIKTASRHLAVDVDFGEGRDTMVCSERDEDILRNSALRLFQRQSWRRFQLLLSSHP